MLTRTECLELVGTTEFGHLTFTRRALPVVVPAHYVLDGDRVQIHASTGGNPDLWRDGEIVALHVDAFDADQRAGWSVSVTGAAQAAANLVGAESLSRAPWLPAGGGNFIAVSTDLVWATLRTCTRSDRRSLPRRLDRALSATRSCKNSCHMALAARRTTADGDP